MICYLKKFHRFIESLEDLVLFKNVCVILPCLNEAIALPSVIKHIRAISTEIEILVVDNSSTDDSFAVATKLGVRVVRENKKGKGYAVRRGFLSLGSQCSIVVLIDCDDTYSLTVLPEAIELVGEFKYDMVVGNRVEQGTIGRKIPFRFGHAFGNVIMSKISNVLYSSNVNDALSGFRVMSRNFIKSFTNGASGFEIENELNAHAFFLKASVKNINVEYKGRMLGTESKLNTIKDGFKIFKSMLRSFYTYRPRAAYSLNAGLWLAISIFLGLTPVIEYLQTGTVPRFPRLIVSTGALVIAVQLWITGIILERVNLTHLNQARKAYQEWR